MIVSNSLNNERVEVFCMIKAVIFDLDGVIVNTDELHYKAWKMITNQEGIEFNPEINHGLRGISRMDSLNIILEKASKVYTEEEKIMLASKKNHYYVESLKTLSKKDILPGISHVINLLKQKQVKIAIGSSSKNAKMILEKIGLLEFFDAIADGNDIEKSKPAPDVFLKAAKKLGVLPTSCIVVEDAESGIAAAKNANMLAAALFDARKSPLADYRFDHIEDLLEFIL